MMVFGEARRQRLKMSYTNRSCFKAVLVLTLISAYVILALVSNLGMLPIQANLGSIKELQESELNKRNYTISIWKVGARMQRRFLRSFGSIERDPFAQCSVRNCRLEVNDSLVRFSDAVMFHLHLLRNIKTALPKTRPINQQWIFFTDESPYHTFMADPKLTMKDLNGLFNLSMTYRSDSDIPIPYGRTEKLLSPNLEDLTSMLKSKTKGVTILGSNCDGKNGRWDYVHELAKYIQVDIFGRCGKQACPEHFSKDCDAIKEDYEKTLKISWRIIRGVAAIGWSTNTVTSVRLHYIYAVCAKCSTNQLKGKRWTTSSHGGVYGETAEIHDTKRLLRSIKFYFKINSANGHGH
ncbi:alpha-(1,3)-fucosyltransferase C-like isoform X5 [Varroa jacobsoni]|uniref:alpha-(1,3)-fucosyltransferase C-like isoform X5 n=1 Tax=Varroa jacobsoni TaxID=62625 RepID=UPI000BF3F40F|nr:alpha-(1,3)-fucosyltransferase C-like isoform X5 [Varroa jacobsoni]